MSKASEWAKMQSLNLTGDTKATVQFFTNGDMRLNLTQANAEIYSSISVPPGEALSLARWILDTFGESSNG